MGLSFYSQFFSEPLYFSYCWTNFEALKKILVIRFSSIGDIVLTTPVIRCLKDKYPNAEIHFITKKNFSSVIASNPYVSKIISIDKEVKEVAQQLKREGYSFVVDLHKNIRSRQVISFAKAKNKSFKKYNWEKFLLTHFKLNKMPDLHIVDRYFSTVAELEVVNDLKGLDFFIDPKNKVSDLPFDNYFALVVGAAHQTKALTVQEISKIIDSVNFPVILVGGKDDKEKSEKAIFLSDDLSRVFNACGTYNLEQSASILEQSKCVITPDTGMMHIASALNKPVISIWGNTVPEFGMYPYIPQAKELVHIVEVKELNCRPCSKIGYEKCPKQHFNCIKNIDIQEVKRIVNRYI